MSRHLPRGPALAWSSFVGIWEGREFRRYLRRRGYQSSSGWPFARRAFLECWAEPGFHRFWRIWNPGLGFLVFRLYRSLGGNEGGPLAKVLAFLASGLAHNLIVFPFLGWSFTLPVAFTASGFLVTAGPRISRTLRQHSWPAALNIILNALLVIGCFDLEYRVDALIRSCRS